MNKTNKWRILIMSDANGQVKQFSLHKIIFYSFLLIFLTAIVTLFITIQMIQTVSEKNEHLSQSLSNTKITVENQEQKIVQYKQASKEIQKQLDELSLLEAQLSEMISSLNPNRIVSFDDDGPQGGLEWDFEEREIVQTSFNQSNVDITSLKFEVPTLVDKYKVALQELEQVKDELRFVPIFWPAETERITSEFGERVDPFTNRKAFHNGIDLAGPWGTEVYATGEGTVELSGIDGGYGRSIVIDHGNSYKTRYGHLSRLLVEEGDIVKQGDLIGLMGTTGRSTGVHLHYEVLHNGEVIDPFPYMTFLQRVLSE
ncbi:M23 family metallopeptidase [Bacillaceae bacterium W0354]